jgi:exportin-1
LLITQAKANPEVLKQQLAIKSIQNVLQTNVNVCTSLGQPFMSQFNIIYADVLQVCVSRLCAVWCIGLHCM